METIRRIVHGLITMLVSPHCQHVFLVDMDFLDAECVKASVSTALGLAIVLGSSIVKVPQVLKLVLARSGRGISVVGSLLELLALAGSTAYCFMHAFPFSSYGEGVFLIVQTMAIILLTLWFNCRRVSFLLVLLLCPPMMALLVSGLTPLSVLWALQSACVPISVSGKMMQAYSNWRSGSTGQLSAITATLLFAGAGARVFTSLQDTGDPTLVLTYVASTAANGVIFVQLLYYWNCSLPAAKKRQ